MNLILISNIFTCVCAFAGFMFGALKFFAPKKAVYAQMITLAAGCMAFGRLYQVVRILTGGEILTEFQLGVLGVIGSLIFLFSANFGLMDSLADDKSKEYLKYRIIPIAAPAVMAAVYAAVILFAQTPLLMKIVGGVITLAASGASYYNLKHLIFPDVDFGVIKCLKMYNLLALVYEFTCIAEMVFNRSENGVAAMVTGAILGAVLLAITPAVERGMKKWTT